MNNFSIIEKLKILIDLISESPLFLFCSMVGISILIFLLLNIKKNYKINRWILVGVIVLLFISIIIVYNKVILNLIDNLFDGVFMALYFPNLSVYLIILLISNFYFVVSIVKKELGKTQRILNIVEALIVDVLLIAIIDIVNKNGINVYDELTIFSNVSLLVLLEINSAIFVSWILLSLLVKARSKLKKYDKKEYPKMQEILFDD